MELVLLDRGVLVSVLNTLRGGPAKLWHAVVRERLEIALSPRPSI